MPASTVRCTNTSCAYSAETRVVELVEVGPGLYQRPSVVCACGHEPRVETVFSKHANRETAVRTPPETR